RRVPVTTRGIGCEAYSRKADAVSARSRRNSVGSCTCLCCVNIACMFVVTAVMSLDCGRALALVMFVLIPLRVSAGQLNAAPTAVQPTQMIGGLERREMVAMQIGSEDRVTLDGVLNEPVWGQAVPASDFRQHD